MKSESLTYSTSLRLWWHPGQPVDDGVCVIAIDIFIVSMLYFI